MTELYADKSVVVNAPTAEVWDTLTRPELTSKWVGDFQPVFAALESDWQIGSPVSWKTPDDKILADGKVTIADPPTKLAFTVHDVSGDFDDVHSDKDGISYTLSETDGGTRLQVRQGDFGKIEGGEKFCRMTEDSWETALKSIKAIAEGVV